MVHIDVTQTVGRVGMVHIDVTQTVGRVGMVHIDVTQTVGRVHWLHSGWVGWWSTLMSHRRWVG